MKISSFFQYSGTNWYSRGAKNMKIPSLIMIFHEFFHYIGLPHPKYRPKAIFMKIDYFSRKTHFLRFGFLTHLTDAYETNPGPSSGAEIKSARFFLISPIDLKLPQGPRKPQEHQKTEFL